MFGLLLLDESTSLLFSAYSSYRENPAGDRCAPITGKSNNRNNAYRSHIAQYSYIGRVHRMAPLRTLGLWCIRLPRL